MNCRTCLGPLIGSSLCVKEKIIVDKTIEEIIGFFVPKMKKSEMIGDLVCSECVDILQLFTKFIERCTIIEELLKEESFNNLITKIEIGEGISDISKAIPSLAGENKTVDKTHQEVAKTSIISKTIRTYSRKSKNTLEISPQEPLEVKCQTNIACSENVGKTEEFSEKLKNILYPSSTKPFIEETGTYSDNNLDQVFVCLKNDLRDDQIIDISEDTVSKDVIYLENIESSIENSDQPCNTVITEIDYEQEATSASLTNLEASRAAEDVILNKNLNRSHVNKISFPTFNDYTTLPHNRVVSMTKPSEEIDKIVDTFSNTNINVMEMQLCRNKNTKRIILVGKAIVHCPVCQILFTTVQPMKAHFNKVHSDLTFPTQNDKYKVVIRRPTDSLIRTRSCPVCGKYFISSKWLERHLREVHKDYYRFKCEHCGKGFKRNYLYVSHLKNYNTLNTCNVRLCRVCNKKFDRIEFKAHMDTHKTHECEVCKKKFLFSVNLNNHRLTHQNRIVHKKKSKIKELCNICGKFVTGASKMKIHIEIHSENRDYMCDKCSKTFKTERFLAKHIRTVHNDKKDFECPICHRRMKKCSKNFHMKLKHSMAYSVVCHICGKGFIREDYYKRHMTHHMISGTDLGNPCYRYVKKSETDFPCKFCDKVFKHVYNLRIHLLTSHLDYTPRIKCRYCDLTFKTSVSRYVHQKRHRDPEMYALTCKVCWNRFGTKEDLEAHSVKHEGSQRHKCDECEETFPSKFYLNHHQGQKHFDQEMADLQRTKVLQEGLKDFIDEYIR